jgi:hypothetical protein
MPKNKQPKGTKTASYYLKKMYLFFYKIRR